MGDRSNHVAISLNVAVSGETRRRADFPSRRRPGRRSRNPGPIDMRLTCGHVIHMSKMIQIRNVPDAMHRKIKARAAQSGMTLSDYLLAEIERIAALPTRDEMLARLHARTRVKLRTPAAEIIRTERESA